MTYPVGFNIVRIPCVNAMNRLFQEKFILWKRRGNACMVTKNGIISSVSKTKRSRNNLKIVENIFLRKP